MILQWQQDDADYWTSEYEVGDYNYVFKIEYSPETEQYEADIDTEHFYNCNSYREAQAICEGYIQGVLDYRTVIKDVLQPFIDGDD